MVMTSHPQPLTLPSPRTPRKFLPTLAGECCGGGSSGFISFPCSSSSLSISHGVNTVSSHYEGVGGRMGLNSRGGGLECHKSGGLLFGSIRSRK